MSVSGTMPKSCCNLPPVQADYTPVGSYSDKNGLKTYFTGEKDSKKAILLVYDVFGFGPQILQGADLLASQGFAVYIPDFLSGDYAQASWFDGSEEGTKQRTAWFSKFPGAISSESKPVGQMIKDIKEQHGKVGAAGFCWGWKVLVMAENNGELSALAGCHPSLAAADDVEKISMKQIHEGVEKKAPGSSFLKPYLDMPHGWMAARGDLKNEPGKKQYHDGYSTLSNFFKQNME